LIHVHGFSPLSFTPPNSAPDTVQAAGNLGYHWGPNRGPPWGTGPEHRLGHLECLQEHDLPATLELPDYTASLLSIK
jgi:hypothetical protein